MKGKVVMRRALFSGLIAIALIVFGSFVATPSRAVAATSHISPLSLIVQTPEGTIHIPIDGKPHLVKQLNHSCPQNSSGCVSQQFIKAQITSESTGQSNNTLAVVRPMYSCPSYLRTWNYTDDYSSLGHTHYYHIELDTEEQINPCNYTLTHIYHDPSCLGYNGGWCDTSSSGSYWDPGASLQRSWFQQKLCISTVIGSQCSNLRLQTNVGPDGGLTCSISNLPGGDPWSCGPL